ncbi:MAG: hypothetical protein ACOYIF_10015 [Acetivibrionales bacterium]|jgi:predicted  nucleic acid-binding Zn-ribbon protein
MEDKIFEFMEKMYADLKGEIKSVGNQVSKLELSIENEIKPDIKALLDGYKQLAEGQDEIKSELADIKEHLVHHDNEIALLKAER